MHLIRNKIPKKFINSLGVKKIKKRKPISEILSLMTNLKIKSVNTPLITNKAGKVNSWKKTKIKRNIEVKLSDNLNVTLKKLRLFLL